MKIILPCKCISLGADAVSSSLLKFFRFLVFVNAFLVAFTFLKQEAHAQGTWTKVTTLAPDTNLGIMLLLSDGTVICKSSAGGTDGYENIWDKLTPDIHGSYINGTWSKLPAMVNTRLFFSSQMLMDGRVYVAGGEYGTGKTKAEIYNSLTNTWTSTSSPGSHTFSDANSEILGDGRIIEGLVESTLRNTIIYNPVTDAWSTGPTCTGIHNESVWVKLADNSILFVNRLTTASERYIPASGIWVADGNLPVSLYDSFGDETGPGFLLPDGRAFFLGSTGHTAYYTPTGTASPGTWAAGPDIPSSQGTPDASGAMMVNGKILCAVNPVPTSGSAIFNTPTTFYEFNYLTNIFTKVTAPGGGSSLNIAAFQTNMLDLPDGTVLYGENQDASSRQYYVYTPGGTPLAAGKPTISAITQTGCTAFTITGTLFNGISEGAAYGDDGQMATNYPIMRLSSGSNVYYARTFNWNRTSVQTGSLADTAQFTTPTGLATGTYSLVVTANGISSDPISFTLSPAPTLSSTLTPSAICSNTAFTYSPTSVMSGTTFTWTRATVTGISNAAITTPQSINPNEILINTTTTAKNVVYVYTTTANGCSSVQNVTVVVNALPGIVTVTGGGAYCSVPGTGSVVGISGSQTTATYQLFLNSSTVVGSAVTGTGSLISFGSKTVAGAYTVVATATTGGCTLSMSGNAVVSITTASTWYRDLDSDGYGNPSVTSSACSQPVGYVSSNTDCNDNNAAVNPVHAEVCGNGIDDNCNGQIDEGCTITLNLKLFIQAFYISSNTMNSVLFNENVSANANLVDTIKVSLVDSTTLNSIQVATGVLNIDGTLSLTFPLSALGNKYYLKINQRSSIETWSRLTVVMASVTSYDFTTAANQAYGNNMSNLNDGKWGLYSGDINQDGFIDGFDYPQFDHDNINQIDETYVATDLNGDGFVDGFDYPVFDHNNLAQISSEHP